MSNLYKGPSKDASYQVSIHLAKWFQRRRFFQKSTNQKQELPVAAMFDNGSELNEQSLQKTFQISIHLAKRLQRRRFFRNQPNQKQELSVAAMFDNRSGRNKQSLERTCYRWFLLSFGSFGQVVSEEIFLIGQSETRIAYGGKVC